MNNSDHPRVAAILLADVVKSSSLTAPHEKQAYRSLLEEEASRWERRGAAICVKDTGDGLLAAFVNATEAAEAGLRLRDLFRRQDWSRIGLRCAVTVRIGLHLGTVALTLKQGDPVDIVGAAVDRAARIEQIVTPNDIWSSDAFTQALAEEAPGNIVTGSVGRRELPKGAGLVELFWVKWSQETAENGEAQMESIRGTRSEIVPRSFSDQDKAEFLDEAFEIISSAFEKSCKRIAETNPHVRTRFKRIHAEKFNAEVFVDGQRRAGCKIWVSRSFSSEGAVAYHEGGAMTDGDNSYNELLSVDHDGYRLFLRPSFFSRFLGSEDDRDDLDPAGAAEFLWRRLTQPLQRDGS